jgi:hypothetical protein
MPVNRSFAVFTFTAQGKIADDRDIQIKGDGFITIGTMRSGEDNGFLAGEAVDQDIKKAAQGST